MSSSSVQSQRATALIESMLQQLAQKWALPGLRLAGTGSQHGAHIHCDTGDVHVDPRALKHLSAATLEVIIAHEAGHLRSYRRRQVRRLRAWLDGLAMLGVGAAAGAAFMQAPFAVALGLCTTLACFVTDWNRHSSTLARLQEEVRADAFACVHLGAEAWRKALDEFEAKACRGIPSRQLRWRRAAIDALEASGELQQVGLHPEKRLPPALPERSQTGALQRTA